MYIVLVFHVRRMRETVALLVFGWGNFFLSNLADDITSAITSFVYQLLLHN